MEQPAKAFKPRNQPYKQREIRTVYSLSQITKKIALPINAIGRNLQQTIEETIAAMVEGKCIVEGYVKLHSVRVITYSSGLIKGTEVVFDVVFECEVCFPVAGMLFNCVAKNITKAGIRAESADDVPSPIIVFIAKDHHYSVSYFSEIQEGDKVTVRVIGQRFELNDKFISIIGELIKEKDTKTKQFVKPRLVIEEE